MFKKGDNRDFRLVQNVQTPTMEEADCKHFMHLRNELVITAGKFGKQENLSPVLITTVYEDLEEQISLADKVVDFVDRSYRTSWETLLR